MADTYNTTSPWRYQPPLVVTLAGPVFVEAAGVRFQLEGASVEIARQRLDLGSGIPQMPVASFTHEEVVVRGRCVAREAVPAAVVPVPRSRRIRL